MDDDGSSNPLRGHGLPSNAQNVNFSHSKVEQATTAGVVVNYVGTTPQVDNDVVLHDWIRQNVCFHSLMEVYCSNNSTIGYRDKHECPASVSPSTTKVWFDFAEKYHEVFQFAHRMRKKFDDVPENEGDSKSRWVELREFATRIPQLVDFHINAAKAYPITWVEIQFLYPYFAHCKRLTRILESLQLLSPIGAHVQIKPKRLVGTTPTTRAEVARPDVEKALDEMMKSGKRLILISGSTGNGKTFLGERVNRNGFIYIPLKIAEWNHFTIHTHRPDIAVQHLADEILRHCFAEHYCHEMIRPVDQLVKYLSFQEQLTLVLDPINEEFFLLLDLFASILALKHISIVLCSRFNFLKDLSRTSFASLVANISVTSFKDNETEQYLERFFGFSYAIPGGLTYHKIGAYSGNNPRILHILAQAIENELLMSGSVSDEDFDDIISDTEADEEKIKMERLARKFILSLHPTEKVVLEAISLYPFQFEFDNVMELLSIQKAQEVLTTPLKPPQYDETSMKSFHGKCKCISEEFRGHSKRELKKICMETLSKLVKLAMIVRIGVGVFYLDSFIRKVALGVFANNPFKYLKVHFCCIQLRQMLSSDPPPDGTMEQLDGRQVLLMLLGMYPENENLNMLNLNDHEVRQVLLTYQSDFEAIPQKFLQIGALYDPKEYFMLVGTLMRSLPDHSSSNSTSPPRREDENRPNAWSIAEERDMDSIGRDTLSPLGNIAIELEQLGEGLEESFTAKPRTTNNSSSVLPLGGEQIEFSAASMMQSLRISEMSHSHEKKQTGNAVENLEEMVKNMETEEIQHEKHQENDNDDVGKGSERESEESNGTNLKENEEKIFNEDIKNDPNQILIKAKYSFEPELPEDIQLFSNKVYRLITDYQDGWILVSDDETKQKGTAPATYFDLINDQEEELAIAPSHSEATYFEAIEGFKANFEGVLSFEMGDQFEAVNGQLRFEHYHLVIHTITGQEGYVPKEYVRCISTGYPLSTSLKDLLYAISGDSGVGDEREDKNLSSKTFDHASRFCPSRSSVTSNISSATSGFMSDYDYTTEEDGEDYDEPTAIEKLPRLIPRGLRNRKKQE